jgi:hypothetical protein
MIDRWEYFTTFLEAQMEQVDKLGVAMIPPGDHPKFSPYALLPELNRLGDKGWELVHIEPVIVGKNHDVMAQPNNMTSWTNTYFCVFKRRT